MRQSRRVIFNILVIISATLALCTFVIQHYVLGSPDRICFTNSRHELYYSDIGDWDIELVIVHDWPGYQPLRWVKKSDGPYFAQDAAFAGETAGTWHGFPARTTYYNVATVANGNGYIDARDQGELPWHRLPPSFRDSHLRGPQPPFYTPSYLTKPLRVQFVQLYIWNVLYLCFWALPALWLAIRLLSVVRRFRSRELERAGRCGVCGYDLRASSDRCPECGTFKSDANTHQGNRDGAIKGPQI